MYAYEQCLLCLGHHPDIWIEAAAFLEQSSKIVSEKGVSPQLSEQMSVALKLLFNSLINYWRFTSCGLCLRVVLKLLITICKSEVLYLANCYVLI